MSKAVVLFASSRREGNTGRLTNRIAGEAGIEVIDLSQKNISAFDYQHRNRGDDFEPLMDRVLGFEKIIFASPIYWYSVSPPMKAFLDRISDYLVLPDLLEKGRGLRRKRGYVICSSSSDEASGIFMDAFRQTFDYLGMPFGGYIHGACRDGFQPELHEADVKVFIQRLYEPDPETP